MSDVAGPAAVQRRTVAVLAMSQVLGGVGITTALAVSSLAAVRVSGSDTVGGLALTAVVLGTALAAVVLARVANRGGRRPALTLGYATGGVGAVAALAATAVGSTVLLLGALLLVGAATAAGLAARFAATDLAEPQRRARCLAVVVWATTVGALVGPNLAAPAQRLGAPLGLPPIAVPFLLCALAFAAAAAVVQLGLRPDPLLLARGRDRTDAPGTPVGAGAARAALGASRPALLGLAGIALGHLVMVGLMSMAPVHLDHGGADLSVVGLVISLHVAGMYALSPLFGRLADRVGRVRVLAGAGVLLLSAAVCDAAAGPHAAGLLAVGLVLLGLGWSAGLIAGSTLLTESVPVAVRPRVQGLADVTMNVSGALGGVVAGLVVAGASFEVLATAAAVLVAPYVVLAARAARREPTVAPSST